MISSPMNYQTVLSLSTNSRISSTPISTPCLATLPSSLYRALFERTKYSKECIYMVLLNNIKGVQLLHSQWSYQSTDACASCKVCGDQIYIPCDQSREDHCLTIENQQMYSVFCAGRRGRKVIHIAVTRMAKEGTRNSKRIR